MRSPLLRFPLRPAARLLALAFVLVDGRSAVADELALDPSVELRTSVDDNFLFQVGPTPTVLVLALTPRLTLSDATENSKLRLDLAATSYTVAGQSADDHTNLNLTLSYVVQEEQDSFNASAGFVRDLTVESELATTGVLLADLTRDDLSATAGWTHQLSERLSTSIQVSADQARYAAPFGSAGVSNYHYYALPISGAYQVSEEDTLTLALSSSLYHADEINNRSVSEELQLALQHTFDERGVVSISVGEFESTTHVRQELSVCPLSPIYCELGLVPLLELNSNANSRQTGSILNASLQYQLDERNTVSAHASRDLSPSGVGSLVLVESIDTNLRHNFGDDFYASLAYSRARSRYIGTTISAFANGYQSASGSLSWRPSLRSSIEIGARRIQTTQDQPGPFIRADEVYANFRYDWPNSAAAQAR